MPLVGLYQAKNVAVAVTAAEVLRSKGWKISPQALEEGLAAVRWPGRLEVLRRADPVILRDGAHNAHGMAATVESLRALFPGKKLIILMGVMADKDVEEMLTLLTPIAEAVVTVRPESPRACRGGTGGSGAPVPHSRLCLLQRGRRTADRRMAAGPDGTVCALGSLYLVGEVRRAAEQL